MRYLLLCTLLVLGSGRVSAAGDEAAAKKIGMAYLSDWKGGRVCQAIDAYWDFNSLLIGAGGKEYSGLTNEEKNYIQSLVSIQIKISQRLPGLQEVVSQAVFTFKTIKKKPSGEFSMTFSLKLNPKAEPAINALTIKKVGSEMKIVDIVRNGSGIQKVYASTYKGFKSKGRKLIYFFEDMVGVMIAKNQTGRR